MTASWMRARAELRGRWRAWVLLGVLLGVAGAVTITAAIGAGRTSTVFDRLVTATAAHDVVVQENDEPREGLLGAIGSLPMVAAAGTPRCSPPTPPKHRARPSAGRSPRSLLPTLAPG